MFSTFRSAAPATSEAGGCCGRFRGFVRQVPQPPGKRDRPLSRAASEVTLSGKTACLERPPAKLRARVLPESRASARLHLEEAVAHCGLSLRYHVAWQATFPEKKVANRAIVETSKAGRLSAQGGGQRLEEGSLYNHVVQELSDLLSSDGGILSSGSPQGLLPVPETCPWIFINSLLPSLSLPASVFFRRAAGGLAPGNFRSSCRGL